MNLLYNNTHTHTMTDTFGLPIDVVGRILLAALLGAVAGAERDYNGRPAAGLRTNMIIAVSSCLATVLAIDVFANGNGMVDATRMTAGIITGVGFLGAGVILHHKDSVKGLTSAAEIWLVSTIGIAVGARIYSVAIFVTLFTTISLILLSPVSHYFTNIGRKRAHRWIPRS